MTEKTVWGIYAGSNGDSHDQFMKNEVIALGWGKMGDLSLLNPEREAFREKLIQVYPGRKSGTYSAWAGELYHFTFDINIGDIVVYPSKFQRKVHICRVKGDTNMTPLNAERMFIQLPGSLNYQDLIFPRRIKGNWQSIKFFPHQEIYG